MLYLSYVVQAAPDEVAYSLGLLCELVESDAQEHLFLFADGERVDVDPSSIGTFESLEDSWQVVDRT